MVNVAVVGSGVAGPDDADAEEVGRRLADAGAVVVCGGLGGVMAAVCRGAQDAGGTTVGILPGTGRHDGNRHLTVAIPTGLGEVRNTLVVRAADAVVAIGGEHGTLSEIAFALKTGVPVVGLRTWELTRGDGVEDAGIRRAADPEDAVALALALARNRG